MNETTPSDSDSHNFDDEISNRQSEWFPTIAVVALVICAAVGNNVFMHVFWNIGPRDYSMHLMLSVALGVLVAQPCLLTVWAVLADQSKIFRVSVSMGILLLLSCLYVAGLAIKDSRFPTEALLIILAVPCACVLILTVPLLIFRIRSGRGIGLSSNQEKGSESVQYGIRHLLILMIFVSVLIPILQSIFANLVFEGGVPWFDVTSFFLSFVVLACLLCMMSLAFVFHGSGRTGMGVMLLAAAIGLPCLVIVLLERNIRDFAGMGIREMVNAAGFAIGLAVAQCLVLAIFYLLGYRMRKLSGSDKAQDAYSSLTIVTGA